MGRGQMVKVSCSLGCEWAKSAVGDNDSKGKDQLRLLIDALKTDQKWGFGRGPFGGNLQRWQCLVTP
jgi:hypothetical protein